MHVELVRTTTRDGLRLDGALTLTRRASEGVPPKRAAILLHGVGGNFYTLTALEPLAKKLGQNGIATIAVNTRGHDSIFGAMHGNVRGRFGAAYEIVDDCRYDIAAWI